MVSAFLIENGTECNITQRTVFGGERKGDILQVAGVNEVKGVYEVLDCLPADIREARSAHKNDLREAIRLFHMGEREEAVKMLSGIDASEETDGVIKKYADYISEMSDEERGNVFRFTRK